MKESTDHTLIKSIKNTMQTFISSKQRNKRENNTRIRKNSSLTVLFLIAIFVMDALTTDAQSTIGLVTSTYTNVTGIGAETGVMRRDPSDIIKVNNLYYVWYSKGATSSGYDATIWYATSPDGYTWTEKGESLQRGSVGTWDEQSVFTPNILFAENKYWLFFTAVPKPFISSGDNTTKTAFGVAVSDSPDGPWVKSESNPILSPSENTADFESLRVDDACLIVRDGNYWFYFKGRKVGESSTQTKMGLAIASKPDGPYVKYENNPVIPGGHEVAVWPQGKGVSAMIGTVGPSDITRSIMYAEDGKDFTKTHNFTNTDVPTAPGLYRPEAFTDSEIGEIPSWGICIGSAAGYLPFLQRFDLSISTPNTNSALDYYVATNGNDLTADGSNPSTPFATILAAYNIAPDGSTIHIAAGTYTATVNITLAKSITFAGAGAGTTIIQPTATAFGGLISDHTRFATISAAYNLIVQDLTLRNFGSYGKNFGGGVVNLNNNTGMAATFTAYRCNFTNNCNRYGAVIQATGATNNNVATFEDCYFTENFVLPQITSDAGTTYTNTAEYGGSIASVTLGASLVMKNCVCYKNGSLDNPKFYAIAGSSIKGRLIYFTNSVSNGSVTISNCTFIDNMSSAVASTTVVPAIHNTNTSSYPFNFINNIVVENIESGNTAAIDLQILSTTSTDYDNIKNNIFTKTSLGADISLPTSNMLDASYTKASTVVAIAGGSTPTIFTNSYGVNYIKATGTKVLDNAINDTSVKFTDINGVTRGSSFDLGAVETVSPNGISNLFINTPVYASNGKLYVNSQKYITVQIYNVSGELLVSKSNVQFESFDLPKGLYVVKAGTFVSKIAL